MNYMDDASTFERSFLQKARQQHIPITGALELLPLCNMNCDMCYVRLSVQKWNVRDNSAQLMNGFCLHSRCKKPVHFFFF